MEQPASTYRNRAIASAAVMILGVLLVAIGIAQQYVLQLIIPGSVLMGVGGKFLIMYLWKMGTGKDTRGAQFWKWVWRKLK